MMLETFKKHSFLAKPNACIYKWSIKRIKQTDCVYPTF